MSILMCRPNYFDVSYDINPWMENQIGKVRYSDAAVQWEALLNEISKHTIVYLLEAEQGVPDLVFTANAGIIYKNTAILSRFRHPQRQPEETIFRKWFERKGYTVVQPQNYFEGAGDLLTDSQGRHWLGYGFRTDSVASSELEKIFEGEIITLELVDPRWYHLDTCFCPLTNGELLWYPGAFSDLSQEMVRERFEIIVEVDQQEAESFACNAVCIKNQIFMPPVASVQNELNILGYNTKMFELGEFQKSGGSAKCLTLQFD